jgi:hypothetical protein
MGPRSKASPCPRTPMVGAGLLRGRRKRPSHYHAAYCDDQLSPSDVGCHATLPWGSCPCNGGTISRFSEGTNNAFALQYSERLRSEMGLNENWPFSTVCQLPPAADITTQMLTPLCQKRL